MRNKKLLFLAFSFLLTFNSCMVSRVIFYNFADIYDYEKFPSRTIQKDSLAFVFATADKGKFPKAVHVQNKNFIFEEFLEKSSTVAFLIIKNDTIQYEKYFDNYAQKSIIPSFSVAKSVTSILIGCAMDEGLIKSVEESITNYIPELQANGFGKVTIEHLLQMTSGIKFDEGYSNPFGDVANFYYGINLRKAISKMKLQSSPGQKFEYASGNTQLLGLVLERALKNKNISTYLEEKIWKPLGMEYDASWSLDRKKEGLEKAFCCLNARARDFAKIGRLYLHKGNWNGRQIVSEKWVEQSTKIEMKNGSAWYYQYQWWLPSQNGDFMAQGILGQYIYVHPTKNLIIVRLGKSEGKSNWEKLFTDLASFY